MLGHLAVPVGEAFERLLAAAVLGARGRGLARVPEVAGDQQQEDAGVLGDGVGLDLDEAVAGVELAVAEEAPGADDAVGVAQSKLRLSGKAASVILLLVLTTMPDGGSTT